MHERHKDKFRYFNEQVYTTREYVIPFIRQACEVKPGMSVLEIGCGEGGNLVPFLDLGCQVTGIDILPSKIENANKYLADHPGFSGVNLIANDIYLAEEALGGRFDLIMMRDVIEHIHDQNRFMDYVKRFLKPGGVFFIAFPPWQNPFGGHQQVAESRILSKLPYYHLLPTAAYRMILKAGGESREKIDALLEIKQTGISIERFEKTANQNGYRFILRKHFLFNPNYQVKFNIRPKVQYRVISAIPWLRNYFTTAVYYLISDR